MPSECAAQDTLTFSDIYYSGLTMNQWLWNIGLATVGAVVAVVAILLTGGGTIPVFIGAVGAKIGALAGLSGAAATSYGLALLGGGSLAAGGFGMVGGVAALTALFTFTMTAIPQAGFDYALNKFNEGTFIEKSKNFVNVPFPTYKSGDHYYEKAMEDIASMKLEEGAWSPFNRNLLSVAKEDIVGDATNTQTKTLQALIELTLNEYRNCSDTIEAGPGKREEGWASPGVGHISACSRCGMPPWLGGNKFGNDQHHCRFRAYRYTKRN